MRTRSPKPDRTASPGAEAAPDGGEDPLSPDEPLGDETPAVDDSKLPRPARAALSRETRLARVRDPVQLFLDEARRHPRLGEGDEKALAARVRAGDLEAARRLVLHNLRLVVAIAYQYRRAWANILDLFQEGSVGLMEAVRRWEPALGSRFGSYAAYWIRAYILRFLMTNARMIHVGNTRAGRKLFFRLERERQKLIAGGFEPTTKRLAAALDVDEADVEEVGRHLAAREVSTETTAPGADGDGPTVGEGIASAGPTPEDLAARSELSDSVARLMKTFEATLTDERELCIWREHLAATESATLGDLGARFGITKQRMGQIVERLKKRFRAELLRELGTDIQMSWLSDE